MKTFGIALALAVFLAFVFEFREAAHYHACHDVSWLKAFAPAEGLHGYGPFRCEGYEEKASLIAFVFAIQALVIYLAWHWIMHWQPKLVRRVLRPESAE